MSFGWTLEYVDEQIDSVNFSAISTYLNDTPPLHVLVARYFGIKPKLKASTGPKGETLFDMGPKVGAPFKPGGTVGTDIRDHNG